MQSQITGVTNDIAILENTLSLKEKVANKSNEIDDSTQLYPSNKAVQTELKVRDANIQQLKSLGIDDEEIECYMLGYLLQIYTDFLEIHKKK